MKHKLKEYTSNRKPSFTSDKVWKEYTESGDRKAFYRMNLEKTVISSTLITLSLTNVMSGLIDIFKNPHPFSLIDFYQIGLGLGIFAVAILIVYTIDRAEELRQLRQREETEKTRDMIQELIDEYHKE